MTCLNAPGMTPTSPTAVLAVATCAIARGLYVTHTPWTKDDR